MAVAPWANASCCILPTPWGTNHETPPRPCRNPLTNSYNDIEYAMLELIADHREQVIDLCRRHHVRTLELFGSAAEGNFDPDNSDLDFLVDFLPLQPGQHAPAYFGLLQGLQDLFQREIDLVMVRAIRNPYFLKSVNQSRRVLYAA